MLSRNVIFWTRKLIFSYRELRKSKLILFMTHTMLELCKILLKSLLDQAPNLDLDVDLNPSP